VLETGEKDLINGVMRMADRTARGLMVPRRDVETASVHMDVATLARRFRDSGCTRLVVLGDGPDDLRGVLHVRGFERAFSVDGIVQQWDDLLLALPNVLENTSAMDVVGALRASPSHMVAVIDEHGHFDGIVTPMDLLEGIAGAFPEHGDTERAITERSDGGFIVSGWMPADAFVDHLGLDPALALGRDTAAGVVLDAFGRLPAVGERTDLGGWTIEVVDMDGRRVDGFIATQTA